MIRGHALDAADADKTLLDAGKARKPQHQSFSSLFLVRPLS
jgi:hypothetical protein